MKRNINNSRSFVLCMLIFSLCLIAFLPTKASPDVLQGSSSSSVSCPTTIKVILIQFNDVKGDQYWDGSSWQPYDNRYKMSDFEDLLTSLGTYNDERGTDGQPVFGSFRDYFYENSRQSFSPTVNILNSTDSNGYPVWLDLSGNKSSYSSGSFLIAANSAAASAGFSTTGEVCYIYAGNWVSNIGVFANRLKGDRMVVPERYDRSAVGERTHFLMTHIGYYAHEFGHLMGAHHPVTSHHHALMHSGHKAGTRLANRPASMNPWFLCKSGWASLTFINSDMTSVNLSYNTSPTTSSTFYIRKIPGTTECFLVENRQYSNTYDQSLPGAVLGKSGGILIWNILNDGLYLGETDLLEADAHIAEEINSMANDMFRPDVYTSGKINDITTPADLNRRNGSFSGFAIKNFASTTNPLAVDFLINFVAPPTNLQITNAGQNGQNPVLSWTASPEPDLDEYVIYRGVQSGSGPINWESSSAGTTTNTTWTDILYFIDTSSSSKVHYRVTAKDNAGGESDYSNSVSTGHGSVFKSGQDIVDNQFSTMPIEFTLHQNYPNPFNPETQIRFELPEAALVQLGIYSLRGEQVRLLTNSIWPAGVHSVTWDSKDTEGRSVASGVYVYRLDIQADTKEKTFFTRKMTLLR